MDFEFKDVIYNEIIKNDNVVQHWHGNMINITIAITINICGQLFFKEDWLCEIFHKNLIVSCLSEKINFVPENSVF